MPVRPTRVALAALSLLLVLAASACGETPAAPTAVGGAPARPGDAPTAAGSADEAEPAAADEMATDEMATDEMAPDAHAHDVVEAEGPMSVDLEVVDDPIAGWNVLIVPSGFAFAPEQASGEHVDGVGHAHLYVDGEKVGRVYTEWVHVPAQPAGAHEIRVTLNANDHRDYAVDGEVVAATATVEATEAAMGHHHDEPQQAAAPMSVAIDVTEDARAGFNLQITTEGFTWAPELASTDHVDGMGHAHLFVDGEKIGRLYGSWAHLGMPMTAGEHVVEVVLSSNHHADYAVDGVRVADQVAITVSEDRAADAMPMGTATDEASQAHGH